MWVGLGITHPVHSFWPGCPAWLVLSDAFKLHQSPHLGAEIVLRCPEVEPGGNSPLTAPDYYSTWNSHLDSTWLDVVGIWQSWINPGFLSCLACQAPCYSWPAMLRWENWELWAPSTQRGRNQSLKPILHYVILFLSPLALSRLCANQISPPLYFAACLNGLLLGLLSKGDCSIHQSLPETTIMEMKPSGDVITSRFHFKSMGHVKLQTPFSTLVNYKVLLCFTKLFIGFFKAMVIILSWNMRATYLPRKQWPAGSF